MLTFAWATSGLYLLDGAVAVLLGAVMPEWLRHYHASYALGGRLVLVQAVGFVAGVPAGAYAVRAVRTELALSGAALLVGMAEGVLCLLPPQALALGMVALNGVGSGAVESLVAGVVLQRFPRRRALDMSRLEVSFGLGALGLPAVASACIALGHWRLVFLAVALFGAVLALWWPTLKIPQPDSAEAPVGPQDAPLAAPALAGRAAKRGVLALFLLMTVIYVGLEVNINSFMPALFLRGWRVPPALADFSTTCFWIGMVLGRLAMRWVARVVRYDYYLAVSLGACLAFLLGLTATTGAVRGLAMMWGLGWAMSAIYSLVMVYAAHTFPDEGHRVARLVTAMAGVGGTVFPLAYGALLAHLSRVTAVALLALMALALVGDWVLLWVTLRCHHRRAPTAPHLSGLPPEGRSTASQ
ncbi:MAG: MFS transporter [Firmicutes bacterium]|nr:MFS transporter [Bacillota bacterium]